MCVVALSWADHPRWRLVLAGNRDEFHARPASPLARWKDHGQLIAGRDLQSGGSWLGVSEHGRLAVVTNLRGFGDPRDDRASRGALVTDHLSGEGQYAKLTLSGLDDFNPFNLITIGTEGATFLSNRPTPVSTALTPGIHGLSNGVPDEPWPRKQALKLALADWLEGAADNPDALLTALSNTQPIGEAGDPPIFIRSAVYGTRCSTVVAIEASGKGVIIERRYDEDGAAIGETRLTFRW
jgi:uncharacterized protein with NRDE domain